MSDFNNVNEFLAACDEATAAANPFKAMSLNAVETEETLALDLDWTQAPDHDTKHALTEALMDVLEAFGITNADVAVSVRERD